MPQAQQWYYFAQRSLVHVRILLCLPRDSRTWTAKEGLTLCEQ
jgi:hypothetical protein